MRRWVSLLVLLFHTTTTTIHAWSNTLAGDFLIVTTSPRRWDLFPLKDASDVSRNVLDRTSDMYLEAAATSEDRVEIRLQGLIENNELMDLLARVMVQKLLPDREKLLCTIGLPSSQVVVVACADPSKRVQQLFPDIPGELVDMVDHRGTSIGIVPRKLVHQFNLLHRGMGLFVENDQKQWYVHQRTYTKRIFPGLYDMFVGGVSSAGESSRETALREVAEEIGLTQSTLSEQPLLQCIVCTSYNRCVVDLYSYQYNPKDALKWQEEEVRWGVFLDYDIIEAAADLSIMRLLEQKKWPGKDPPLLSGRQVDRESEFDWRTWDFVPDGLLVWEAWLEHCKTHKR